MENCDGFFDNEGIPYLASFQDAAIRAVKTADFYNPPYKKWLILCWFDTTYGEWNGNKFNNTASRAAMSAWLAENKYDNFEQITHAIQTKTTT